MAKNKKVDWKIAVSGIFGLVIIECFALHNGIDGKLLTSIIGIIALAIGVAIPNPFK